MMILFIDYLRKTTFNMPTGLLILAIVLLSAADSFNWIHSSLLSFVEHVKISTPPSFALKHLVFVINHRVARGGGEIPE
jgi:hypothetical protein